MKFRKAKPSDKESIVEMVNSVYRGKSGRQWTSEADLVGGARLDERTYLELIADKKNTILVAQEADDTPILGCVYLQKSGEDCYLGMLSVRASHQQYGLGSKLLKESEEYAAKMLKARGIIMHVLSAREELINWYLRRGYEKTNERLDFKDHSANGNWEKGDKLFFEVLRKPLL